MEKEGLSDWLVYLEALHPAAIDLGLERVREVWQRLGANLEGIPVITIGGTNGKGSSQAMLEAIYLAQGYSVGAYSSPHLLRYNERIRLDGSPVSDGDICNAFAAIEAARGEISLTYFEFGTLTAFWLFAKARPAVLILEVGLGGRLDAVNILDADAALISSIDYDHQDWLGTDIDQIAREKAGILRPGRPGVFTGKEPPQGLLDAAAQTGAELWLMGRDYGYERTGDGWRWWQAQALVHHPGSLTQGERAQERRVIFMPGEALPPPALIGEHQFANAAAVLAVLQLLQGRLPVTDMAIRQGLRAVRLPGRFQIIQQAPEIILDVAHNPEAARSLAATLRQHPISGRTLAIFGIMADKDAQAVLAELIPLIDCWLPAAPRVPRALAVEKLAFLLEQMGAAALEPQTGLDKAYARAKALAGSGDRILVFGSFFVLTEIFELL